MGYYSEVAIAFTKEGHDNFITFLAGEVLKGAIKDDSPFNLLKCAKKTEYEDGTVLYHWDSIKWYWDYPSVNAITKALRSLDDEQYRFVRVGEERGDIEEEGSMDGPPYIGVGYYIDIFD